MKVVHYKPGFLPLTENWVYNQVSGLHGVSVVVYAVSRHNAESFPFDNLRCLWEDLSYVPLFVNRAWNRLFHWYPHIMRWLRKDRPDLVHAHYGPDGYRMLPYVRRLGIPLVTSFYGYDAYYQGHQQPQWSKRYRDLFEYGRLFLAEGPAMREKLVELGCPPEKVVVHHIGIEPGKYEYHERKPEEEVRLMVCGRFVEKKGMPFAVEALARLRSRVKARVRLTIVGDSDAKGTLTDEKKEVLQAIERNDLSDTVTITGYIPHSELLKIAHDHHIFLAPSIHASNGDAEGGFPVILTEVLATGMPVVASRHCDIPEIVQDGESGFLVPERDVDALAERLGYLIEHPEIWPEMGRAGRKFVEENYDIRELNKRLVEIYKSLLVD